MFKRVFCFLFNHTSMKLDFLGGYPLIQVRDNNGVSVNIHICKRCNEVYSVMENNDEN